MGKYMKKARGGRGVMEIVTQGPSGVRTRARSQAMQRQLVKIQRSNTVWNSGISMVSFVPAQISYLELRSRRLKKVVEFVSNELSATQNTATFVRESRRLSDTNSEIHVKDFSSRLAHSLDEVKHAHSHDERQGQDDREHFVHLYHYGDSETADESALQGLVERSLQQWAKGGRAPPSVAHSRSNSRSNSVTREFPSELSPNGSLTRNQSKREKKMSNTKACPQIDTNLKLETEIGAIIDAKAGCLAQNFDVGISLGENQADEVGSAGNRVTREGTQSINNITQNGPPLEKSTNPSQSTNESEAAFGILHSALDLEIEDFFLQAEQQVHNRFKERYNFDLQNEIPLQGRYDWVKL